MEDIKIYTDEKGRIVRLDDPNVRQRINFYGKEVLDNRTFVITGIKRLTPVELADLCLNYYLRKVEDGKLVDRVGADKVEVIKERFDPYLKSKDAPVIEKIEGSFGVSLGK